jgi:hypothetical protein
MRTCFLWLLMASSALAQPLWENKPPTPLELSVQVTDAQPGDLVPMYAKVDAETGVIWALGNSDKRFLVFDGGRSIAFASGSPGRYKFICFASKDGHVPSVETVWITVGNPEPAPPGPEPQPPGPNPGPQPNPPQPDPQPSDFSSRVYALTKAVETGNKKTEAQAIAKAFKQAADWMNQNKSDSKITALDGVRVLEAVMKSSLNQDSLRIWAKWEEGIQDELAGLNLNIRDLPAHVAAFTEIAAVLTRIATEN